MDCPATPLPDGTRVRVIRNDYTGESGEEGELRIPVGHTGRVIFRPIEDPIEPGIWIEWDPFPPGEIPDPFSSQTYVFWPEIELVKTVPTLHEAFDG